MYDRFTVIDDLTRRDHFFIQPEDPCFYLGEYTARGGYSASETNKFILNLKKKMHLKGTPQWKYKGQAIQTAAANIRKLLSQESLERVTFVPVPPSKTKANAAYDDRLVQILRRAGAGFNMDMREMVVLQADMEESRDDRASFDEVVEHYTIDPNLMAPPRNDHFVIFDDMLTTGRHYKAVVAVLSNAFPSARFEGMFLTRRVPQSISPAVFEAFLAELNKPKDDG